jgi:CheY-like chemotaxis protein/CHASE3 domain sensor protein/putative methionine-R-sulfoxide reductase with GAF domain
MQMSTTSSQQSTSPDLSNERSQRLPSIAFVTAATALVFLIMLINSLILKRNLDLVGEHQDRLSRTNHVVSKLHELITALRSVESGQRGFVLTGSDIFLETYDEGRHAEGEHLRSLRDLMIDNPAQQNRLRELELRIEKNLEYHDRVVMTARVEGREAARKIIERGEGRQAITEMNRMIREIRDVENARLAERGQEAELSRNRVVLTFYLGTALSFALIVLAYFIIRRYLIRERLEREKEAQNNWIKARLAELSLDVAKEGSVENISRQVLNFFSKHLTVHIGNLYTMEDDGRLHLGARFAGDTAQHSPSVLMPGQGLVGEVFRFGQVTLITDVPQHYIQINSSTGFASPASLLLIPLKSDDSVVGVIELGNFARFSERERQLAEAVSQVLGSTFVSVQNRDRTQRLLEQSQALTHELQSQQEELRVANEELESQSQATLRANDLLSEQSEELRQINEKLAVQAVLLEEKQQDLIAKNADLEKLSEDLSRKAKELEVASRYKSDFLANMSHELRTPLNSLLILSTLLYENRDGNLNEKQIDFAKTIHRSGNDLLALINDILDLAKIESGRVDLVMDDVDLKEFLGGLVDVFKPLAHDKKLTLECELAVDLQSKPILTDRLRLEQILKNLLSNAIKFTNQGTVSLKVHERDIDGAGYLAFDVVDQGVGIPADKQQIIFEAFQQADTSTSRQYGGTGLGLTISRELASRLGGRIELSSEPGKGSRFTLLIPMSKVLDSSAPSSREPKLSSAPAAAVKTVKITEAGAEAREQGKAQERISPSSEVLFGDLDDEKGRRVLVIEDDRSFGEGLMAIARECGFKAVLATSGEAGLEFAQKSNVAAVLLDLRLPDVSGMSLLERLKRDPGTRHLPIHVISGMDFSYNALKMGAFGYLVKPAEKSQLEGVFQRIEHLLSRSVKQILIVEDDPVQLEALKNLLSGGDVVIDTSSSGQDALAKLKVGTYDCMILDLRLPDITGFKLLEELQGQEFTSRPPVVVYTGKELTADEEQELSRYADSIIIKGAKSPERLMDEVSLFLHRIEKNLPLDQQKMLQRLRQSEDALEGRCILVVDDDMRNVFALLNALEEHGVKCIVARNGEEALKKLESGPDIELVLMDIMMPVMDGFEAMRRIRKKQEWRKLPIIALTAKAMKGDQERCLEAGANDYLMKPIQLDKLVSLMKVWLPGRI